MKRNIAFFISTNNQDDASFLKAQQHFFHIVSEYKYETEIIKKDKYIIHIAYEKELTAKLDDDSLSFPIGNMGNLPIEADRFLKINISDTNITIENDYAGSIPVFFSLRNHCSISNLEPCVVIDSKTNQSDISFENMYGFMHYTHFIWDETLYKHIFTMLPDSTHVFNIINVTQDSTYNRSVEGTQNNAQLSDVEVAQKLYNLNKELVTNSLANYNNIILPLSAGYDSRMILAAISESKSLTNKTFCFTYGSEGSIEVEAARRLAKETDVKWEHIELPRRFLSENYLTKIHDIFGSHLHMHGMYQLEFIEEMKKKKDFGIGDCITSGFMTGVPAGQHNTLLSIDETNINLAKAMESFSQSKYWSTQDLNSLSIFKDKKFIEIAESRFRKAFDRFPGEIYQKKVMFDVWTRQRNFIGYYPRTFEWTSAIASPHMNSEYAKFFMSLSKKHLDNRCAVELMFKNHYPNLAKVISNSNGVGTIYGIFEKTMIIYSKILKKTRLGFLLPQKYALKDFEFNMPAVENSKQESIYPIIEKGTINKNLEEIFSREILEKLCEEALQGNLSSYLKLTVIQSIGLSLIKHIQK